MSEWKEVWYVWDRISVPLGGKYLLKDGSIRAYSSIGAQMMQTDSNSVLDDIRAFTLGEKRRRCVLCKDGLFCYEGMGCVTCETCNGTGRETKK